ncbi:SPRY domain containing protein [Aureococcus anophagefferens]|nr:SPRY domain containing protein [Aureococcus anophagefferens]
MSFLCCCCRKSSEAPAFELGVLDYPLVRLDRNGGDVSVESSATGDALGGSGVAYTSTAIEQDAAYWELHVEAAGPFRVGVCRELGEAQLGGELGDGQTSWALDSAAAGAVEGDVIGVAFGQAELPNLSFFLNGELLEHGMVNRIRGEVFPAASVTGGAKLRCVFDEANFEHAPPRTHYALRVTQNII